MRGEERDKEAIRLMMAKQIVFSAVLDLSLTMEVVRSWASCGHSLDELKGKSKEYLLERYHIKEEEPGVFRCPHIETCPNVLQACERKVAAETALEVAKAEYDGKRKAMNDLFAAGVAMRKSQRKYFADRTHENLVASKAAEKRFDEALEACRNAGKPTQPKLI